jgi:hypothetical protein
MKKFAKLIPVALGLLTLASCSNDDLLGESAAQQGSIKLEKGEMLVTLAQPQEDGSGFTRGYTSRDMKQRRWWSGVDKLRVYGSQFGAYDTWMFVQAEDEASGKFKLVSSPSYVAEPKWALFPYEQISNGKWTSSGGMYNSSSEVDVDLPQTIKYDAAYDAANYAIGDAPYYLDNLPRYGEVTSTNEGEYLSTKLNFMTGILRLQLAGTPKYAKGIKVQLQEAGDPAKTLRINGTFTAKIAQNDVMIPAASIVANYPNGAYAYVPSSDGSIYVYIEDIEKLVKEDNEHSVIYLPLPVWDKQVDIVVSIPDVELSTAEYDGDEDGNEADGTVWKEYKRFKNKTIQLGKVYGNKSEYNLAIDGTNPEAISDALELIETDEETITLVATNPIDVCAASSNTTIEIPNKEGVKNIIIDLRAGLDGCATGETLNIVYKNSGDKFTGNVTLLTPALDGANPVMLNVDLDESGFAIVQGACLDWSSAETIDIDAAEFVVGNEDKFTPTTLDNTAGSLKFSKNVTSLVIAKEGQLVGDFAIDQSAASEDDWVYPAVTSITVNGVMDGAIDADGNTKPGFATNVVISGESIDNGGWQTAPTVTGDILTKGTVDINAGSNGNPGAVAGVITADGAITATGFMTLSGAVTSDETTIALAGHVNADVDITAKGNISITEEATVASGNITSKKGNITIDNAYMSGPGSYSGTIIATEGSVSLNEVGWALTTFAGDITAANEFTMTGLTTTTGDITAPVTATINVDAQNGNCKAVQGTLTLNPYAPGRLNLLQGYVNDLQNPNKTELYFAEEAAYAAIANVADPDKLVPQNASIWNGDYKLAGYAGFATDGYAIDTNNNIWTATQLGYMNTVPQATVNLRSNINLNNETWPGITATAATEFAGNYKTISNVNIKGDKATKTAGFFNTAAEAVTISNLTFDGVQTNIVTISGGEYDGGIGAVAGRLEKGIALSRVIVKLAGDNFGTKTDKNVKTANVGGLVGCTGWATLTGVQVDASATTLTGYKNMGGFIGRAYNTVTIKMAEEDGDDPEVMPTVTGLKFYVTYLATEGAGAPKNDPAQGSTGHFIGYINVTKDYTISDVDDVKPTITVGGKVNEQKAILIESPTDYFWFMRDADNADQTLIGNSGFDASTGNININGFGYEIYKTGVPFTVGHPKLYSLIKDAYIN